MTFTSTSPTKPGFYAITYGDENFVIELVQVRERNINGIKSFIYGANYPINENSIIRWCFLVPAEEVEKAYKEGMLNGRYKPHQDTDTGWLTSNARKVVEGESK